MSRTFRMWIYGNTTMGRWERNQLKKACLALSCRIYLVIWVPRWLRGSICNWTILMIRQEDVSHRIFRALWSCFHNKVVIFDWTIPCHYLHSIVLIYYWHSLIIMETFISLLRISNKTVRLGLWHLQFPLELDFWHNVLNDCVIIVLEKKKIDSLRWTNWQEGKNSAKTDLEGLLFDRNLLFFMVGFDI